MHHIHEQERTPTASHFHISGAQRGQVRLFALGAGMEYKNAALLTPENFWQEICFTPDLRLVINLQGHTHLKIEGRDFELHAGTDRAAMLLPTTEAVPGHKIYQIGSQHEIVLFFDRTWLASSCAHNAVLRKALLQSTLRAYYFPITPTVAEKIAQLQQTHHLPEAWRALHQQCAAIALLAESLALRFPQASQAEAADTARIPAAAQRRRQRLQRLREMLHDSECSHMTLTDLARASFSNPTTLQRDFAAAYGQSIDQYRRALKLAQARDALRQHADVQYAAAIAGYGNIQSFTRAFKKHFGHGPLQK